MSGPPSTSTPSSRPAGFNTKSPTIKRILQESRELSRTPDPTLTAAPLESNLFEWHFTITGPPASPYAGGIYHGRIVLPPTYPLRPPSFRFLTPSGRFEVNREICLSISGHHEETWQPAWGIRTALCAIRAFMAGDARGQVGGLDMSAEGRERLAKESRGWRCAGCSGGIGATASSSSSSLGKTNEEIIKEVEDEWRESGAGEREAEAVPEELRLAFREDLQKEKEDHDNKEKGKGKGKGGEAEDEKSGQRQEAGDARATVAAPDKPVSATSSRTRAEASEARVPSTSVRARQGDSVQSVGRPSSTTVGSARQRVTMVATSGHNGAAAQQQLQQGAVPAWLDKAIVGIGLVLLVMVLKKFAASDDY